MRVFVAVALPDRQEVLEVYLPAGSTVADALAAARLEARFPGLDVASLHTGIWSRACSRGTALREGDRVELYRALQVDPKESRRARAKGTRVPR